MSMRFNDRIYSAPRGSAAQALLSLGTTKYPVLTDTYIKGVYEIAPKVGMDPSILVAQGHLETGTFKSDYFWLGNVAGIGIWDSGVPSPFDLSHLPEVTRGYDAAAVQIASMWVRTRVGVPLPAAVKYVLAFKGLADYLANTTSLFTRFPVKVELIDDLNIHFGINERECTWACDDEYHILVPERGNLMFPNLPDQEIPMVMTNPTFIIIAGHQGAGDSGGSNGLEKQLTGPTADVYVKALKDAGYKVIRIPDGIAGGLDGASRELSRVAAATPGDKVILDIHYEGAAARGVFSIYPRSDGLTTAIPVTGQGLDVQGNNVLDEKFGSDLAKVIGIYTGLPLRSSGVKAPGLMQENQTGVGGDGWRLATFAYTAPYQPNTIRLVVEHGSLPTIDKQVIQSLGFYKKLAIAVVDVAHKHFPLTPVEPGVTYTQAKGIPPQDGLDYDSMRSINRLVTVGPTGAHQLSNGVENAPLSGPDLRAGAHVRVYFKQGVYWIAANKARLHEDEIVEKVRFL